MNYQKLLKLEESLVTPKRFNHINGVVECSQNLAKLYYVDYLKCTYAAVFHDWCKDWTSPQLECYLNQQQILDIEKIPLIYHGIVSANLNNKAYCNIFCFEIYEAIKYHTTLSKDPNAVTKVLFIADYIEPSRKGIHYDQIRAMIGKYSLDYICAKIILQIQTYLNSIGQIISTNSLNYLEEYIQHENICSI